MSPFLDAETLSAHKQRNLVHSVLLLAGLGVVLAVAMFLIWGLIGVAAAMVAVGLVVLLGPRVPPRAIMRVYRARHYPRDHSQLSQLVDELSRRAELPNRPELYVIPSSTLNAFATGAPEQSAIAITEGLLRKLTMREICGVLAHEMSHIRNNDLWVMGLADVVTRLVQPMAYVAIILAVLNLLGWMRGDPPISWWAIGLLYFAPAISSLLQLALSRSREFDADLEAAMLTGDPTGLASALERLETYTGHVWEDLSLPVPTRKVPLPSILRTHPSTDDRIRRLMALTGHPEVPHYPQITVVEEPRVSWVGIGPIEMRPRYRWPGLWF